MRLRQANTQKKGKIPTREKGRTTNMQASRNMLTMATFLDHVVCNCVTGYIGITKTNASSKKSEIACAWRIGYDMVQYLSWVPSQGAEKCVPHWKARRNSKTTTQQATTTSKLMMMTLRAALRPATQKMRL